MKWVAAILGLALVLMFVGAANKMFFFFLIGMLLFFTALMFMGFGFVVLLAVSVSIGVSALRTGNVSAEDRELLNRALLYVAAYLLILGILYVGWMLVRPEDGRAANAAALWALWLG